MLEPALVGPGHKHQLGRLLSVHLGDGLVIFSGGADGVAVDIDHQLNGGIFLQPGIDILQRPAVGAVVGGIIVQRLAVDGGDPPLIQQIRDALAHCQHIAGFVRGPVFAGGLIGMGVGGGIGLGAVGMHDEHLNALPAQRHRTGLPQQQLHIDLIFGLVLEIDRAGA